MSSFFSYLKYVAVIPFTPVLVLKDVIIGKGGVDVSEEEKYNKMKVVYDDSIPEGTGQRVIEEKIDEAVDRLERYIDSRLSNC